MNATHSPSDSEAAVIIGRLAGYTTKRMCFIPRGRVLFDVDDFYAVAYEGGWKAHARFDSSFDCAWKSWVIHGIRRSIQEALRNFDYGARKNRSGVIAPEFVPLTGAEDSNDDELIDRIADPRDDYAAKAVELDCAVVIRAMRWIPPREAQVLRSYFLEGMTMKTIARQMEISESRVFQIHAQAKVSLRQILLEEGLDA